MLPDFARFLRIAARRLGCGDVGGILGSLDDPGRLGVGYHIFVADKVPYDAIGDSAPRSADGTFSVVWT